MAMEKLDMEISKLSNRLQMVQSKKLAETLFFLFFFSLFLK